MPGRTSVTVGLSGPAAIRAKAVGQIATKQVTIEQLETRYGWKEGSWQDNLLQLSLFDKQRL